MTPELLRYKKPRIHGLIKKSAFNARYRGEICVEGNIIKYLENVAPGVPPEIMSTESYLKLHKMASLFRDFVSEEYILETCLDRDEPCVDFSFCIRETERELLAGAFKEHCFKPLTGDEVWKRVINFVNSWSVKDVTSYKKVNNIWLEMDSGEHGKDIPRPCFFFDASQVKSGTSVDSEWVWEEALKKLLDDDLVDLLQDKLKTVIRCLPPGTALFQVGTMLSRNEDRVRIFTSELTREQTAWYLKNIGWPGNAGQIKKIFDLIDNFSDGRYIVDFDVTREGISEKTGINFGLGNSNVLPSFLGELAGHNLCTDLKKRGISSWKGSSCRFLGRDYGQTALLRNISHFKVAYSPGERIRVKAYLKVAGVYLKELFKKAYSTH